ncbi:hypothetical protein [Buttiauxella agrestis]|uniref:hypothetical protein n=1 Tax=Buttiauxella agrestis TaxID=82977 RepID=UPI001560D676|nr:hypothetical protein [Buttiauxella agrestis]BCG08756.1 hypothetical protein BADSM9389_14150 [Buttiauxella agrestis]
MNTLKPNCIAKILDSVLRGTVVTLVQLVQPGERVDLRDYNTVATAITNEAEFDAWLVLRENTGGTQTAWTIRPDLLEPINA